MKKEISDTIIVCNYINEYHFENPADIADALSAALNAYSHLMRIHNYETNPPDEKAIEAFSTLAQILRDRKKRN